MYTLPAYTVHIWFPYLAPYFYERYADRILYVLGLRSYIYERYTTPYTVPYTVLIPFVYERKPNTDRIKIDIPFINTEPNTDTIFERNTFTYTRTVHGTVICVAHGAVHRSYTKTYIRVPLVYGSYVSYNGSYSNLFSRVAYTGSANATVVRKLMGSGKGTLISRHYDDGLEARALVC